MNCRANSGKFSVQWLTMSSTSSPVNIIQSLVICVLAMVTKQVILTLTPGKILNSLICRTLFYVNIYRSYKLSENSPFFWRTLYFVCAGHLTVFSWGMFPGVPTFPKVRYIERYSMSTYTGVTNFQKTVRFSGPPCTLFVPAPLLSFHGGCSLGCRLFQNSVASCCRWS